MVPYGTNIRTWVICSQWSGCCHRLYRPALQDIQAIVTPLCVEAWARELGNHPDKAYAAFIFRGIQNGLESALITVQTHVRVLDAT